MPYPVENARFQWEDGERRLRDHPHLAASVDAVLDELRRRLGSRFTIEELAGFYGAGVGWADEVAARLGAGLDAAAVVDAAFARYAGEASDFAGGRLHA